MGAIGADRWYHVAMSLTAESVVTVAAAITALVQILKWGGLPDGRAPWAVLGLSLLGVLMYQLSFAPNDHIFARQDIWPIFAAWIAVALSSAGVYGFTRSLPTALTSTRPSELGSGPVPKHGDSGP
jgi:hypothetical protein